MAPETAIFIGLFNNLAIAIVLVAIYGTLIQRLKAIPPVIRRLALGFAFGLVSIVCMYAKIPVVEGVIVDQRNALVALSGVFGGPVAGLVCGVIAACYRYYLGGSGVLSGTVGVGLAVISGAVLPRFAGRMESVPRAAMMSLAATLIILPGFLLVGDLANGWRVLKLVAFPYGTAIFLGMFLIGLLLAREERRQNAEQALLDALRDAERANERKLVFLATMSHELRTPMNAIMGFSEIMAHQYFGPMHAKYSEYVADIHKSATHLLALINDILDVSSIEVGRHVLHKEDLALGEVLRTSITSAELLAGQRGITFSASIADNLPRICADRRAITQIVQNILDNALKFTPAGGRVSVSARRSGRKVTIRISDTGVGIKPDDLPKVTEPFARTSDPYVTREGVGLGLSIVKSLTEAHDGQLGIQSESGKGTTVEIVLPASSPVPASERPRAESRMVEA